MTIKRPTLKMKYREANQNTFLEEKERWKDAPKWELMEIKKALSIMSLLNTQRENIRLEVVTTLLKRES